MSVLHALWGCGNLRQEASSPDSWQNDFRNTLFHNTFQNMRLLSMDNLCHSVCSQIIVWWCQHSCHHTVHPSFLFLPFLWSPTSTSLNLPLLSFQWSPSVSVFLFLPFSGCVFSYFSWQVNRWFWSQWRCTFSSLVSLWDSILGSTVYRRCSLEALC